MLIRNAYLRNNAGNYLGFYITPKTLGKHRDAGHSANRDPGRSNASALSGIPGCLRDHDRGLRVEGSGCRV